MVLKNATDQRAHEKGKLNSLGFLVEPKRIMELSKTLNTSQPEALSPRPIRGKKPSLSSLLENLPLPSFPPFTYLNPPLCITPTLSDIIRYNNSFHCFKQESESIPCADWGSMSIVFSFSKEANFGRRIMPSTSLEAHSRCSIGKYFLKKQNYQNALFCSILF